MIELKDVTIVCIDTHNHFEAIRSLKRCLKQVKPEFCLFLTDIFFEHDGIMTINIDPIKSKREYSEFVIKKLYKYITTQYLLIVQWDGFILDANQWTDEFLKYDYIGAPWNYDSDRQVGNGGFSLRSLELHKILAEDNLIDVLHPEDQSICIVYKFYLEEKYGIKFAPRELAERFAYETITPTKHTFGFHNYLLPAYQPTVVIKRTGAMGDVVMVEPVLDYYSKKGYRVVLDTLIPFYLLFLQHKYPVLHISQFDTKIQHEFVDLDMSYEENPKQLHLISYYQKCGIQDGEIKSPNLYFNITKDNRLFEKYWVLHIDERPQPYRNVYGIDWAAVVESIKNKGYQVIQIGKGTSEDCGAVRMNTPTENLLMYLIAGASGFIGIDSGPSHIAAAFNIPSILFFGSVDPAIIHPDMSNKICINMHEQKVCDTPYCWHNVVGCEGVKCYVDEENPPCTKFSMSQVTNAINKLVK